MIRKYEELFSLENILLDSCNKKRHKDIVMPFSTGQKLKKLSQKYEKPNKLFEIKWQQRLKIRAVFPQI